MSNRAAEDEKACGWCGSERTVGGGDPMNPGYRVPCPECRPHEFMRVVGAQRGQGLDVLCPECRGKGRTPGQGDLSGGTCGVCRGRGMVPGAGAGAGAAATAANSYQHGGDHYKQPDGGEEHWDRVWRLWGPGYFVGNITKYAERCMLKDGVGALRKCGHYVAKLIELLESGVPPGYMGRAGGKPLTEQEAAAVAAEVFADLRAEEEAAHPVRVVEGPPSALQVLWNEIDVVCRGLDACPCGNRAGGEGCDECKSRKIHLRALRDEVKRQLAVREMARAAVAGAPWPVPAGAGACTCGADRTGPSAEAHAPGCPAEGTA
jgi:hypothetical protein